MSGRVRLDEDKDKTPAAPPDFGFDYSTLDEATANTARAAAKRIRTMARDFIAGIGDELMAVRDDCFAGAQGKNAGDWGRWIEGEFGWSKSTAYNYINASKLIAEFQAIGNLSPTSIYLLAAAPPTAVDEVVERLEANETLTGKDVATIVAERKKAAQLLKDKPKKKPKSLPRAADEPEASTTTWTNSKAEDEEEDEPIGRDRSVADDADEDEDDPPTIEEHWEQTLASFAENCTEVCDDFVRDINEQEFELPEETVELVKASVVALNKLADSLGIDVEKREEAA